MRVSRKRLIAAPRATRRLTLLRAMTSLVGVVAVGTLGIMFIEGWALGQSLFFTLITLTTIGYGDYGLSENGKFFTIFVMIGGLAAVTYSAGQILPSLFNYQLVWERKMSKRIHKLNGHFIVVGAGRIGRAVCAHLARDGVPFIAIDPNPDEVAIVVEADQLAIVCDATEDEVLKEAGIERARAIACVTGSDADNMVTILTARELNPDLLIVSRAENEHAIRKMQRAGATRVISPIRSSGVSVANAILKPNLAEFLDRTAERTEDFELAEITVHSGSVIEGATIDEARSSHEQVAVIALKRPGSPARMSPRVQETLDGGDVLIVAGDALSIDAMQSDAAARRAA